MIPACSSGKSGSLPPVPGMSHRIPASIRVVVTLHHKTLQGSKLQARRGQREMGCVRLALEITGTAEKRLLQGQWYSWTLNQEVLFREGKAMEGPRRLDVQEGQE